MLVERSSDAWYPPDAIQAFRCHVAEALAEGWDVVLVAYDDDVPEDHAFISAAVVATSGRIRVDISRHAGSDTVLVRFGDSDPVPFEDLAVAKGELDRKHLVELSSVDDPNDARLLKPLVCLHRVLEILRDWRDQLHKDLHPENSEVAARLQRISDEVAAGLFRSVDP